MELNACEGPSVSFKSQLSGTFYYHRIRNPDCAPHAYTNTTQLKHSANCNNSRGWQAHIIDG